MKTTPLAWLLGFALVLTACVESAPEAQSNNATPNNVTTNNVTTNNATTNNATTNNATTNNATTNNATTNNATTNNATTNNATTNNANNGDPWPFPDWSRRVAFDVTPTGFDGELSPFTALVRLDVTGLGQQPDRETAIFVRDGERLDHEVVAWNDGDIVVWLEFQTPLTADQTEHLWLYWDSSELVDVDPRDAWANGVVAAYHFEREQELGFNSAKNDLQLTCDGTCARGDGVAGTRGLDASSGGLVGNMPDVLLVPPGEQLSISAWYRPQSPTFSGPIIFAESYCVGWQLAIVRDGLNDGIYTSYNSAMVNPNTFTRCPDGYPQSFVTDRIRDTNIGHNVVLVIDRVGDQILLYIDREFIGSETIPTDAISSIVGTAARFRIGTQENQNTDVFFTGATIDEVLVLNNQVSAEWIAGHNANIRNWSAAEVIEPVEEKP